MKKIILSAFLGCSLLFANAQAIETQVELNKVFQPCITVEYIADVNLTESTIAADMKERGFGKAASSKGYMVYRGINFMEISSDKIDFYIKAEKKSKKEKEIVMITALASKGYDNFLSGASDAKAMASIQKYLNELKSKVDRGALEQQITEQEDAFKKEDKKTNSLIDDLSDLEKKKKRLEQDIEDKKRDIEKQKANLEKQRQILEAIKSKRKA
jgi:hypothetical protein